LFWEGEKGEGKRDGEIKTEMDSEDIRSVAHIGTAVRNQCSRCSKTTVSSSFMCFKIVGQKISELSVFVLVLPLNPGVELNCVQ